MLSYMLPMEEKCTTTSPTTTTTMTTRNYNLSLNLNGSPSAMNGNGNLDTIDETTKLLASERCDSDAEGGKERNPLLDASQREDSFGSDASSRKIKMSKLQTTATKSVALKRVSFGSSKGSMVETLVFEAPTPLPEHSEREFSFPEANDDSGIELQEELERSKVRVSFFQSSQPQCVSPPDQLLFGDTNNNSYIEVNNNFGGDLVLLNGADYTDDPEKMAAVVAHMHQQAHQTYDRQISTESGWDNPFRPGGDLSREADEIVNLIKGGKPITPTGDPTENGELLMNGGQVSLETVDGATKVEASQLNAQKNGGGAAKSPQKTPLNGESNGNGNGVSATTAPSTSPQTQVVPGPQSASHVIIEDKKKKKCTCCVIQ